jgi:N-acetylglucosaminyldiphosphoundecaprenol N-acetyl-beta-D-mannosaminyltransferase
MLLINETAVFGVRIDLITSDQFTHFCTDAFRNNVKRISIFTPNIDFVYNAYNSSYFKSILKRSFLSLCDSEVLRKLLLLKGIRAEKITGIDLVGLLNSMKMGRKNCFLLGSTESILKKTSDYFKVHFKQLRIIGQQSGYFEENRSMEIIRKINESKAQILLVGMGSPKQEIWVDKYIDFLNVNLIACIGGAFDIFSGTRKRAPGFIQKNCLEWLFRLIQNPRHLWKRYLIRDIAILARILPAFLSRNSILPLQSRPLDEILIKGAHATRSLVYVDGIPCLSPQSDDTASPEFVFSANRHGVNARRTATEAKTGG